MKRPLVEIFYFAGCPNYECARRMVESAAAELGLEPPVELVEVESPERASALRFLGSPTVRINGRDVEPGADEREDFAFSCRVYRANGGVRETPDPLWIRSALVAATR
jgi:hypothetical protein